MALKTMSIDKLLNLKSQVEATLASKVSEQRRALESELSKLGRFQGGAARGKSALGRGAARGSVAPKYRNPENPVETWAGRGLKPRWLTAAIKGGKNIEDFAIAGATTSSKANGRKKARKARK
jgi:DNA-binding protein H-NS